MFDIRCSVFGVRCSIFNSKMEPQPFKVDKLNGKQGCQSILKRKTGGFKNGASALPN
jgi:hypothetical protein